MSECPECARLEREREAAWKAGDRSKATDCVVLMRRHPNHDEPEDDPTARTASQVSA